LAETANDQRPLVLLDGMSLAFRAFFALPTDIATSEGLVTNALHGFAAMLLSLVRTQSPRALAVAFDLSGGTFRDAMVEDYKGGRAETPPEIEHQFELIRNLCEVLHIPVLGVQNFEADDVLATLATWGRNESIPVVVVTGDRDAFQLVEDPYVKVLYNRRGVSDYSLYDEAGIFERCGIESKRYPLLAALRGDTSDNLPGVPGVGEKTAAKLFATYSDMDDLYAHLGDLTPKLRENLATYEERARNNEKVMMLIRDVPLDFTLNSITLGGWNRSEIDAFFDRFEMNQMRTRFGQLMKEGLLGEAGATSAPLTEVTAAKKTKTAKSLKVAKTLDEVLASTTTPVVAYRHARAAVLDAEKNLVALCDLNEVIDAFAKVAPCGHDLKALYRTAASDDRVLLEPADDTAIMAFLLDANSGRYDLAEVAQRFLGEPIVDSSPSLFDSTTSDETLTYEVALIARLREHLHAEIAQWELNFVYEQIELPLVMVLALMEARGVRVDVELLRTIAKEFTEEAASLDKQIQKVAGHEFKVNSPAQLQSVLFDEMGLTAVKKIKSGYSTDASSLEAIQDEHTIIPLILRYREVEKLRGTYGAPLIDAVQGDGRIHATFQQMVARTGRLSSDGPNLHNIPVRSKEGRRLRYAFITSEGWEMAVSDYNQIELRILAHLSQDSGLLSAFASNEDVHRTIAASVFAITPADVSPEQREQAKAVSYGLAYGMEAFGLSRRLGVPVSVAKEIMDKYFSGFPSLRSYMDQTIKDIRAKGFSRTEFGRIRPFPDIATATGPQRQAAERQAMNSGIQGLAADIFKSALVRLDRQLRAEGLRARLILQVHDEVVVEAPYEEKARVEVVMLDALTNAASLSVPLEVSLHWGENWAAAKGG
jgi:DNA polymerase I